jgi:hypothetical protein
MRSRSALEELKGDEATWFSRDRHEGLVIQSLITFSPISVCD